MLSRGSALDFEGGGVSMVVDTEAPEVFRFCFFKVRKGTGSGPTGSWSGNG